MSLLFATSFGPDLYQATGRRLLDSFLKLQRNGRFLVCYEGDCPLPADRRITPYALDQDEFLQSWLQANRDVIPDYLGGLARECGCAGREQRHARHRSRCHWQWMNRNASRWFRKVASLRVAAEQNSRFVVWLDSDVEFLKDMHEVSVARMLQGRGTAYCKGHRPGVESGVVLFDLPGGGKRFIQELCRRYTSRAYLRDERWDDGFQFGVVGRTLDKQVRDLVHPTRHKGKTNNVIPLTVLAAYLRHDKGIHGTGLNLMK